MFAEMFLGFYLCFDISRIILGIIQFSRFLDLFLDFCIFSNEIQFSKSKIPAVKHDIPIFKNNISNLRKRVIGTIRVPPKWLARG